MMTLLKNWIISIISTEIAKPKITKKILSILLSQRINKFLYLLLRLRNSLLIFQGVIKIQKKASFILKMNLKVLEATEVT